MQTFHHFGLVMITVTEYFFTLQILESQHWMKRCQYPARDIEREYARAVLSGTRTSWKMYDTKRFDKALAFLSAT